MFAPVFFHNGLGRGDFFHHGVQGFMYVFLGVGGGDEEAQTGRAFLDAGKETGMT